MTLRKTAVRRLWESLVLCGITLIATSSHSAPPIAKMPKAHVVVESSISPAKRFGVSAFDPAKQEMPESGPTANTLVELKTNRVVATLASDPAPAHGGNHIDIMPSRWSPDGSLLLWEVDGKWFHYALLLVRLENGKVLWQRNVMQMLQKEILARTRQAQPKKYAAVKKDHEGWGSAYPDGFSVEVEALDPLTFPVHVRARLASETKVQSILDYHLEGEINAQGELKVTKFAPGPGPIQRNF